MRKNLIILVTVAILVAIFTAVVSAQRNVTIELNNTELELETIEINGKIWVPIEDFSRALNIKYDMDVDKRVIKLRAPAKFVVYPRYVSKAEKKLENKYFFKLAYAEGNFNMDVYVNDNKVGTYNGEADVEITKYLKKGTNEVKIVYRFTGGHSGFYFAIQELPAGKNTRVTLDETDTIYTKLTSSQKSDQKIFEFVAK